MHWGKIDKMKVMFVCSRGVINSYNALAKIFCALPSSLAEKGMDVVCVCNEFKEGLPAYPLSNKVKFVNLSKPTSSKLKNIKLKLQKVFRNICSVFMYRKFILQEKPDVIIFFDFSDIYNVLFWQDGKQFPCISMFHGAPFKIYKKYSSLRLWLEKKLLKKASAVQVLMESFIPQLKQRFGVDGVAIPNSVPEVADDQIADLSVEKKKIVSGARISPSKQQHLLVEAFAQIAHKYPDWVLEMWNSKDDTYFQIVSDTIKKYGLEKQVFYKGLTSQIYDVYKSADFIAFPSQYEGFSLALSESLSFGLPAVGFKNAYCVNELISDGKNGFLAADVADFAQKMEMLIQDKNLRIKLGKQAHEDMKKYSMSNVVAAWEKLIKNVYDKEK